MNRVSVTVDAHGPMFDGRAAAILDRAEHEWEEHLAEVGADYVRGELHRVLRKETPYYRLQITSKEAPGHHVVTDQDVVYGPWLEGTSSRNRTTRFKGYATFRRITARLNADANRILQPYVDATVDRINHGS